MGEWETGAKAVVPGADAAAMRKAAVVESFMVVLFYEIQTKQWRIFHHGASACLPRTLHLQLEVQRSRILTRGVELK